MSRWGRCDFSQFREFTKGFEKLSDSEIDNLCVACSKELAARLKVKPYKWSEVKPLTWKDLKEEVLT